MRVNNTDRIGVYAVGHLVSKELDWIFREQPLVDVGIDALLEEAIEGNPTGKFLAAQIKTGLGNFNVSEKHLTLYVSKVHYHYWLNLDLPIILVAHIPDSNETLWELINEQNLKPTDKKWKINIPKNKLLQQESLPELASIVNSDNQDVFTQEFIDGEVSDEEMDFILSSANSIGESESSTWRMNEIVENLGAETSKMTTKINGYVELGYLDNDSRVKKATKNYAELLTSIARKLDEEIDVFADYFSEGIRAYEKLAMIYFDISQDYKAIQESHDTMIGLPDAMNEAIEGMKFMRNEVSGLPSKYSHLKKAKIKFTSTINEILNEFKVAKKMSEDFTDQLSKILD
ncbi:MAG: DUF4365 domain-containing protein [Reichenbachiella sp.]|uniref:DUF4365 domain-containing protein n=1 Tax=Reichenbachiella sp. TaxID=2184521 RepID=UPI0032978A82